MKRVIQHTTYRRLFSLILSLMLLAFEFYSIPQQAEVIEQAKIPVVHQAEEPKQDCHILTRQELSRLYSYKDDVNKDTTIDLTLSEAEILMKLAMSEAGDLGEDAQLIIMNVIINRLNNDMFPDSVYDVVNATGQFAVMTNGAYNRAEPNTDSHLALARLEMGEDISEGALYFESASNSSESWHSKNRVFLFERYGQRFYR